MKCISHLYPLAYIQPKGKLGCGMARLMCECWKIIKVVILCQNRYFIRFYIYLILICHCPAGWSGWVKSLAFTLQSPL